MKKFISIVSLICVFVMLFTIVPSAAKTYQTYTYSIDGLPLDSPDAYTPIAVYDSSAMGMEIAISEPRDLEVDEENNVYIADSKNNRIVVLDAYFKFKFSISTFVNDNGVQDELTYPQGVFVKGDSIYVCDTDANRIVIFDREGNFKKIILQPDDDVFAEGSLYKPVAIAVDDYGRMFIVSSTTYQGIIVMTTEGEFIGIIGAQAVSISAIEMLWRRLMTEKQKSQIQDLISVPFNNIAINDDGFIYVTTSLIDEKDVSAFLKKDNPSGEYSPVKMLNAQGDEIMRRNGFFPPAGEIQFYEAKRGDNDIYGPSRLVDVALGPEKTWSIIDEKRDKIFTYDYDGNLLFAFGDIGPQLGQLSDNGAGAIVYQGDKMLILDKVNCKITVFGRTDYGDIIVNALANQNARQYDRAVDDWKEILKRNSNFDAAYIGIGQAYFRQGEYEQSIEYYKAAYDTENYSNSYKEIRKAFIEKYIFLLAIVIVAIVGFCVWFLKYAGKVNQGANARAGKKTFKEELLYGFHLWLHPFDGFWDLKHEKRGSVRAALVYLAVTVFAFFYQAIGQGYVISPQGSYTTILSEAMSILVPVFLFVIANWCLTTLFNGEGSFKDVFIAVSYSLLPLPVAIIPTTLISNWILESEIKTVDFIVTIAFVWTILLIFFGTMVTHDYSMFKNLITIGGTIIGMVFIMFVGILFSSLLGSLVALITSLISEINYRM